MSVKDARGWRLVHGFAFVGGWVPGEHAWLRLPDGRVWDPTENVYATMEEYELRGLLTVLAVPLRRIFKPRFFYFGL